MRRKALDITVRSLQFCTDGRYQFLKWAPRQQQHMEGKMKLITRALLGWSLACVLALPALAVDPIRIGVVDELTGPQAEAGYQARNR